MSQSEQAHSTTVVTLPDHRRTSRWILPSMAVGLAVLAVTVGALVVLLLRGEARDDRFERDTMRAREQAAAERQAQNVELERLNTQVAELTGALDLALRENRRLTDLLLSAGIDPGVPLEASTSAAPSPDAAPPPAAQPSATPSPTPARSPSSSLGTPTPSPTATTPAPAPAGDGLLGTVRDALCGLPVLGRVAC